TLAGVIAASLAAGLQIHFATRQFNRTDENLKIVQTAMADYLQANGHYPCPASSTTARTDSTDGDTTDCSTAAAPAGIQRTPGRDPDGVGPFPALPVRIGALPYKALEIPVNATLDGYGNRISYAVTEVLANPTAVFPIGGFNFNDLGAIDVLNESGTTVFEDTAGNPAPGTGHFYIFSHGEDGLGAFSNAGVLVQACGAVVITSDNCDGDATFRAQSISKGTVTFDDQNIYTSVNSIENVWERSPSDPNAIHNSNVGNVGIGKNNPAVPLDVNGNVQGDRFIANINVHSDQYCDENGVNCMLPEVIGGTGMICPPGEFMRGIQNNTPICAIP
ncbi:MAG: hypothetical protein ACPGRX_06545, partial [Bdellovibrionales bacterium]